MSEAEESSLYVFMVHDESNHMENLSTLVMNNSQFNKSNALVVVVLNSEPRFDSPLPTCNIDKPEMVPKVEKKFKIRPTVK